MPPDIAGQKINGHLPIEMVRVSNFRDYFAAANFFAMLAFSVAFLSRIEPTISF
jgi:hypothetical protein